MNLLEALKNTSRDGIVLIADARGGIKDLEETALFSRIRRL